MSRDQLFPKGAGDRGVLGAPGIDVVLVILPTFNEAGTLAEVVGRLRDAVEESSVLIIDDASSDGTGAIADALAAADPGVTVLHRHSKQGLGTAYLAGFAWAATRDFDWIVQMDADGSHLPEQLPDLLAAAQAGAGLVIGTRWIDGGSVDGWPWYRRLISRTGTRVARIALRSKLRDITSGLRVLNPAWVARLPEGEISAQGYGFQVEVAWGLERQGCPIAEVPITFVERRAGRSKMSLAIVFEALVLVLRHGWRLRFGRSSGASA